MCKVCLGLDCEYFRYNYGHNYDARQWGEGLKRKHFVMVHDWCEKIKKYLNLNEISVIINN